MILRLSETDPNKVYSVPADAVRQVTAQIICADEAWMIAHLFPRVPDFSIGEDDYHEDEKD